MIILIFAIFIIGFKIVTKIKNWTKRKTWWI